MKITYASGKTPDDYKCSCGATGVKLWREYSCFSPSLFCYNCAVENQREARTVEKFSPEKTALGWLVAAVPDEEGVGYWGYTSVPQAGVSWWKNLPAFQVQP
jgi:hypothetical protein